MIIEFNNTEYPFDLDNIEVEDALTIKRVSGFSLKTLEEGLAEGDPEALRALYWLMLKQNGEDHRLENIRFKLVKFAKAVGEAQLREAAEIALKRQAEDEAAAPKDDDE